jgi:hypothetical protein
MCSTTTGSLVMSRCGQVRHVVIEVFPVDTEVGYGGNAALLSYLYDMGFVCAHATMGPSGALQPLVAWPRWVSSTAASPCPEASLES